jgi:hypothetical protein
MCARLLTAILSDRRTGIVARKPGTRSLIIKIAIV